MHRGIPRLFILALLVLAAAGHAAAVPQWEDDAHPGSVTAYDDTDCDNPSACLASDDDDYLYAYDHAFQRGSSPIDAARKDPVPSGAVLHNITLNVKLESGDNAVTDVMVWNGDQYETVAETGETDDEIWLNRTVTGIIAKQDGEYPVRIDVDSLAGGKEAAADYVHLVFRYTEVGSLSYSTANSDDSPVLGSSTVQTGETTSVETTTVCSGGYCGQIDSLLRANGTAIGNVDGLSLTAGSNPRTTTLCDGNPEHGTCSTAELSAGWEVEGTGTGAYGIDVKTASDYSSNGVNEPESSESVLTVEGGSLSTSITLGATEVVEGESFDVTGDVTCDAANGCTGVTLAVEDGNGNGLGGGTTPFATAGTNPKDCGDLGNGETCSRTWTVEATGDGTADYDIQISASSPDSDISGSTASDTVTIEAPFVSINDVSAGGSSTTLDSGFDYSANVDASVTCTLNGAETCSTQVTSTGGSTSSGGCTIGTPGYSSTNDLECKITNSTHGIEDAGTGSFSVAGSLSGATTNKDVVSPGDTVTVYCGVKNGGDIRYEAGEGGTDYSSVRASIVGPDGETVEKTSTDPTLELGAGSSTTESETLTVPDTATEGEWSATCTEYQLIDSIVLAAGPADTAFQVNGSDSDAFDVGILSPNPRNTYYTGQDIDVVVSVENAKGNRVTGADVTVNGKQLRDDGNGADEQADDGLYSRAMVVPDTLESYRLSVRAEKNEKTGSTSSILTVQNGIAIDTVDVADTYRIGDTVTVNGSLVLNRLPRNTSVDVQFVSPAGSAVTMRTDRNVADGQFAASYTLGSGAETGVWAAEITVEDEYDSDTVTEEFDVQAPNPGAFYLNFLSPTQTTFRPGETIPVEVRPESSRTGNTVTLEQVECRVAGVETTMTAENAIYQSGIDLPLSFAPGSHTVSCTGERMFEGGVKESTNAVSISVEPIPLDVEVIEPASGVVSPGENASVVVNVTRRGTPVENATIDVLLDGRDTSFTLHAAERRGVYRGTVTVPQRAESVRLQAADAYGNMGDSEPVTVRSPGGLGPGLLAIYLAIFLAASIAVYGIYRRYLYEPPLEKQEEEMARKLRSVEESLQDTQRDYFNREIDEEAFREMMEKYKEQKTQLKNELAEVRAELEREDT